MRRCRDNLQLCGKTGAQNGACGTLRVSSFDPVGASRLQFEAPAISVSRSVRSSAAMPLASIVNPYKKAFQPR
jgi:hypothetical protein